jgi:hypothetical protein
VAHNSKRNKRHTTAQDGDDYVYPTKKARESKTRGRKRDKNLIQKGLVDYENIPLEEAEWYDDQPMSMLDVEQDIIDDYNQMVIDFNEAEEEAKRYDQTFRDDLYDDAINDIYGSYEEDY